MQSLVTLLGRLFLSGIFVFAFVGQVRAPQATIDMMRAQGMPLPNVGLPVAMALALAGSLSLILGLKARIGALLLILYLVPASLYFHDFWTMAGAAAQAELIRFLSNVALAGGLLMVVANGPGRLSLDARGRRPRAKAATS